MIFLTISFDIQPPTYYWYEAGLPVEFHLYQNGGHGFGLGNPNRTSNRWFDAFTHWLEVNGFLAAGE